MPSIEDTAELRLLAEQLRRLDRDPRRAGLIDVVMLAVIVVASVVVTICWVSLATAHDHFPVDAARVMLTSGTAACIIAATFAGMFGINRVNRRRYQESMEKLSQLTDHVRKLSEARQTASVGYATCFQQLEIKLDLMAIEIGDLKEKAGTFWNGYTAGVSDITGEAKVIPMANGQKH